MTETASAPRAYQTAGRELLAEAFVLILAAALIYFFALKTYLMSAIIAAIIILRFIILNRKGDFIFFLLGLVLGGGNDLISMFKKVYYYLPPPDLSMLPIPLWMLFFWGMVFVFFRKLMRFGPLIGEPPKKLFDLPIILDLVVVVAYRLIIYRTADRPWLPDALFAAILVLRVILSPPAKNERLLMLAILALGPVYEIWLIHCGLYVYQTPVFFGMPLWLIVYWLFVIRFLKAVTDRIESGLIRRTA